MPLLIQCLQVPHKLKVDNTFSMCNYNVMFVNNFTVVTFKTSKNYGLVYNKLKKLKMLCKLTCQNTYY